MSRSGVDEREVQFVWIRLCRGVPCYRSDNTGRALRPPRCGNARAPYPSLSTADTRLTCSGRTTPSHLQAEATVVGSGRRFALLTHESRRSCHEDSHLVSAFTSSARIVIFVTIGIRIPDAGSCRTPTVFEPWPNFDPWTWGPLLECVSSALKG